MSKKGIKIIDECIGLGPKIKKGDKLIINYDLFLNKGDFIRENQILQYTVGDRNIIAGLRYGIDGMKIGGTRKFKASPHLCYGEKGVKDIPTNALLLFDIKGINYDN